MLYLAAAVGMTPRGKQALPLLLLVRALLRARETAHALVRLRELVEEMYPEMVSVITVNPEKPVEELLKRVVRQDPPPTNS